MPANPHHALAVRARVRDAFLALLFAAAALGVGLAALRAWEADPCTVDSIDGPRPCTPPR